MQAQVIRFFKNENVFRQNSDKKFRHKSLFTFYQTHAHRNTTFFLCEIVFLYFSGLSASLRALQYRPTILGEKNTIDHNDPECVAVFFF
jgi:hypothetical protein